MNFDDEIRRKVDSDRLLSLANASRVKGDLLAAEDMCRQALDIDAKSVEAIELLGDVLCGLGKLDEALVEYRKALDISASLTEVERKYARVALDIGDRDREREMVQRAIENPKKKTPVRHNAAIAMLLSAAAPGVGQIYNGEIVKGAILGGTFFIALAAMAFSPGVKLVLQQGLSLVFLGSPNPGNPYAVIEWPGIWFTMCLGAGLLAYVYSVIDAPIASLKRAEKESKE